MKIVISNFGPVKEFELDLSKNLSVVYGENNIGKSYSMSLTYVLIKKLYNFARDYSRFYFDLYKFYKTNDNEIEIIKDLKEGNDYSKEIFSLVLRLLNNTLGSELKNAFERTFGDLSRFNKAEIILSTIEYYDRSIGRKPFDTISVKFKIENSSIIFSSFNIGIRKVIYKKSKFDKIVNFGDDRILFNINEFSDNIYMDIEFLVDIIFKTILDGIIYEYNPNLYFIPASRSGIYFILKDLTLIQLEYAEKVSREVNVPRLTEPHSDFFKHLTSINSISKQEIFIKIARFIEEKLIDGSVDFDIANRTLYYKDKSSGLDLNLDMTSSMVSEMSLITAFFKYVINSANIGYPRSTKPILFIEEPEAHLHPTKQILFAEILGEIVKTDSVRVVISSHSNYIFNKLNNMIMAKELDHKKYSAYVLKKGKGKGGSMGKLLKTDELGTDDENFTDVSDQLYNERLSIIDKMNKKNGKK